MKLFNLLSNLFFQFVIKIWTYSPKLWHCNWKNVVCLELLEFQRWIKKREIQNMKDHAVPVSWQPFSIVSKTGILPAPMKPKSIIGFHQKKDIRDLTACTNILSNWFTVQQVKISRLYLGSFLFWNDLPEKWYFRFLGHKKIFFGGF